MRKHRENVREMILKNHYNSLLKSKILWQNTFCQFYYITYIFLKYISKF